MDLETLYPILRSVWTVWFTLLFVGILAWAFWPARKGTLQEHGSIPLRDDPEG